METARISDNGQITIPLNIIKEANLKYGSNITFAVDGSRIIIESAGEKAYRALIKAQEAFKGAAEEWGLKTDQDVVDFIKQIRREKREEKKAENNEA